MRPLIVPAQVIRLSENRARISSPKLVQIQSEFIPHSPIRGEGASW
jgi:hypothetical protein